MHEANTPIRVPLDLPLSEPTVRTLHAGDPVALSGVLFTARDAVHKHLADGHRLSCDLRNAAIYHCGPVTVRKDAGWSVIAAGPTTSSREEPYMPDLIRAYRLRAIIGKGGMGADTLRAMQEVGCVYLHAVGGAAQLLAARINSVEAVYGYDRFGAPEAVWQLRVRDFPCTVTMDSFGNSLHRAIRDRSQEALQSLLATSPSSASTRQDRL